MAEDFFFKGNYTILIAEDNEVNMFFLKTLLKMYMPNVIILEATDGEKVENTLTQIKPDLIFLDLSLPLKDGYEIAKDIKKKDSLKDIPIIVLTATESEEIRTALLKAGINIYIKKPAGKDVIFNALKSCLKSVIL